MATRRKTKASSGNHSPSLSPAVTAIGIVVGTSLTLIGHYPGAIFTWLFVIVAAWLNPSAEMTGKKDTNGYPTPAHAGEEKSLRRYRFWSDLKWRMFSPNLDWWFGWPVYASTLIAVWVAGVCWYFDSLLGPVSAVFGYITVSQIAAARRRNSPLGEPCPGTVFGNVKTVGDYLIPFGWRAGVGALAGGILLYLLTLIPYLSMTFGLAGWVLAITGGSIMAVQRHWSNTSLAYWRELVAARKEWKPRWEMLKQEPAPAIASRTHIGDTIVDVFDAPANQGAAAFYGLASKILPTIGTNTMIFILPTENVDADGQPIQGTQHPLRFRIATMTQDGMPDLTDINTSEEEVRIALECAVVGTLIEMGAAAPVIGEITSIVDTEAPSREDDERNQFSEEELAALPTDIREAMESEVSVQQEQDEPTTHKAAWAIHVLVPNGPPLKWIHTDATSAIEGRLGCEVIVDWRNYERMFVGSLTDPTQQFVDYAEQFQKSPEDKKKKDLPTTFHNLETESVWMERWEGVLKTTVNFPAIEHEQYFEYKLKDGVVIHSQSFVTLRGDDLGLYFGNESKLATALEHMPFVASVGFLIKSQRRGERHPQAFTILWASGGVPSSPDKLQPSIKSGTPTAEICVLRGRVNEAFKAARLPQPEVFDAKCLTANRSRGHIWKIHIRLYGGVTLSDIRGAAQRIKQSWGCPWLRVTEAPNQDGIIIIAGANPAHINPADETVRPYLTSLDWEQAWLDAKISGVGGLVPKLKKVDVLPDNNIVQVLDFQLPSGLSLTEMKAARSKLEATTANAYVEVRPHPNHNPADIQLYVAKESPMPSLIEYDFDFCDSTDRGIPFATSIEGRPICLDLRAVPHLLLAGASGSGKSVSAQGIMYGAIVQGAQVVVIDVQKSGADFKFAERQASAFVTDIFEAEAAMKAIYAEVKKRAAANGAAGVGHSSELADPPPPIVVFIDEFLGVIMSGKKPSNTPEDDHEVEAQRLENIRLYQAKKQIAFISGRIAAEARSADVHLVLMTQKLVMAMLDDDLRDIKTNLARILIGKTNSGDRMSALRDAEAAPPLGDDIPKGRGIWESTMEAAQMAQFWFAPASVYERELAERVPFIDKKNKIDFESFLSKADPSKNAIFGQRIKNEKAQRVVEEEIELGGFDFDLDDDDDSDEIVDFAALGIQIVGDESEETELPVVGDDLDDLNWVAFAHNDDSADSFFDTEMRGEPKEQEHNGVSSELDLSVVNLPHIPDEDSMFGWGVLDSVSEYLDNHHEIRIVTWSNVVLDEYDEFGVSREDMLREVVSSHNAEFIKTSDETDGYIPVHAKAIDEWSNESLVVEDTKSYEPKPVTPDRFEDF